MASVDVSGRRMAGSSSNSRNNSNNRISMNKILFGLNCAMFFIMVTVTHRVLMLPQASCPEVSKKSVASAASSSASSSASLTSPEMPPGLAQALAEKNSVRHLRDQAESIAKIDFGSFAGVNSLSKQKHGQETPAADATQPRPRFIKSQLKFAAGMARVDKEKFMETYNFGYPERSTHILSKESENVLIIYSSENIIPKSHRAAAVDGTAEPPLFTDPEEATSMCDVMNVVVTGVENPKRCLVIMDHYESHHVEMWKREEADLPLQLVPRNTWPAHGKTSAQYETHPPRKDQHKVFFEDLQRYLKNLDVSVEKLRLVLKPIAIDNTVIVMVSNHGQSNVLVNFACAARAKGFNLSNLVVFCTDEETVQVAEALGFATFYDKEVFARVPTKTAALFGDLSFIKIVWGKVVAAHLVSMLGYDFLFQDVDVVWYKDPMKFFMDKTRKEAEFDMLFQDDGVRTPRFSPFSANSGFYFARHNDRTLEFFTARVLSGNQIMRAQSDQAVVDALLIEHSSLYGLRVKTLKEEEFAAGRYTAEPSVRKWLIGFLRGENQPWVFHMNWTVDTKEKLAKMKQVGMWYLKDTCPALEVSDEPTDSAIVKNVQSCCLIEPAIECTIDKLYCAKDYPPTELKAAVR